MAEENETPGGESGRPPGRRESDLLAERRARRAAEGGEQALIRRAEAAEATVHTLERHVHSLQQRLREAEEEHARLAAGLTEERTAAETGEQELRSARQREYEELQLRRQAEQRVERVERELSSPSRPRRAAAPAARAQRAGDAGEDRRARAPAG